MTAPTMLPGLAEIAAQVVSRTAAAELPSHVQPGRTWRNGRSDGRGTWHLPRGLRPFAEAICGGFIVAVVNPESKSQRWIAEGKETATCCRSCLRIIASRDAAEVVAEREGDER